MRLTKPAWTRGQKLPRKTLFLRTILFVFMVAIVVDFLIHSKFGFKKQFTKLQNHFTKETSVNEPQMQYHASTPNANGRHDKWIVVTSIFNPTAQLRKLSQIPGWKVVVVADKKTPKNWKLDNVVFLDTDTQESLGYAVLEYIPWNSYTRKVIGYLYAIQNGAQYIYDTDDDNAPNDPATFETNFVLTNTTRGLVTTKSNTTFVANPYSHFGQSKVWPRGYPLDKISEPLNNTYTACPMHTPIIQQGLVNGDPDVDAIFRLTRKFSKHLNITFDGYAPPIIYPRFILAPFNSQNTLFHYDAFWSLLLPISVTFRVTDIWRGYWAQPLLWKIGGHLGFYPPRTTQKRNVHVYLKDFGEEAKLYKQSGDLAKFLSTWKCTDKASLYNCMLELTSVMADMNMWETVELDLMQAWIADLKKVGYVEPKFQDRSPCLADQDKRLAMFTGVDNSAPIDRHRKFLRSFCNATFESKEVAKSAPETLLIIAYNFPHYQNIWLLDLIYRPHYPNILYCGNTSGLSSINKLIESPPFIASGVRHFSFAHASKINEGKQIYECALLAIDMKYSVSGYLIVSDDILFNFWNTFKFNRDEMWIQNGVQYLNINISLQLQDQALVHWAGWINEHQSTNRAINTIRASNNSIVKQFLNNREKHGVTPTMIGRTVSDVFYVAASKQEMYYEVGSLLLKAGMYLEVATPLLAAGLSTNESMVLLRGVSLWDIRRDGKDIWARNTPFKSFNVSHVYLHPVKLSRVISDLKFRKTYCSNYIFHVLKYS